ncbi:hypothetical protein V2J09_001316 [Rumex salicifolius]
MPKRNSVVILSSDEEEDAKAKDSASRVTLRSRVSSKYTSSAPRSRKPPKKARCSGSQSAPSKDQRGLNEFKSLYEDFNEDFAEFKVSAVFKGKGVFEVIRQEKESSSGFKNVGGTESWVEKYKPRTIEELAVHKKKVEEVRAWLVDRLKDSKKQVDSNVLLITGSAGVGKSVTIQVLASHFGAELFEWDTPTPTIWQEHVHNSVSGIRYISKLDEFENFVERVRKFGLLPSSTSLSSIESVMLLIDDLPVVYGKMAYKRLLKCLQLLAKSVQKPTVIVVTDYGGAESGDNNICSSEELWLSIKNAGAYKVVFNPITVNSIKKVLSRISRQEQCNTTSAEIDFIASASEGDIRNAIQSLQYLGLNPRPRKNMLSSLHTPISSEGKTTCVKASQDRPLPFGRDQTLSLLPLKMDAPEKVLCQAYGQARSVAEFLHENAVDFIAEDAVKDAWVVASYFSDADCLLSSSLHHMFGANNGTENIAQLVAASVAARGVLFGNAHPSLPRWHTIRKPALWRVEQSSRRSKFLALPAYKTNLTLPFEMDRQRSEVHSLGASGLSVFSTEYRPMLQWIQYQSTSSSHPYHDDSDNEFNCTNSDQEKISSTDDEIEDL